MRVTQFRKVSFSANLFVGAKCVSAIPVRSVLERDVLLQASLDAAVRKIEFVSSANVDGQNVQLNSVVVERDGRRYALEIEGLRPLRDIEEEALALIALSDRRIRPMSLSLAEVCQEPRRSNARNVWRHHNTSVGFDDRANVIAAIEECGPLSINQLEKIVSSTKPISTVVCALACEASIEIDLIDRPLGARTMVRAGSAGYAIGRGMPSSRLV